ncbi:MAG TPA: hypothetical protein VIN59_06280 [Alphaproteobacteria bacterium]
MLTETQYAIEVLSILNFIIIGLSHIFHRAAWAEFFIKLHSLGASGVFAHGFLSLIGGTLIVAFHNVWSGIPMILTVIGWLYVGKSVVTFLFPSLGLKSLAQVSAYNTHIFIVPGIVMIAVGLLLSWNLWLS